MRFVHLTDPHLTSLHDWRPPVRPCKRWSGYLSWRSKRSRQLRPEMLDQLIAAVRGEDPTLLAITGDLAHIGLPQEIRQARDWLVQLGPPGRVLLVPGNHDVYARDSWPAIARHWSDYLQLDAAPVTGDGRDAYPIVREIDGVVFVGVSSSLPTAPLLATGRLGAAQLGRLQQVLRDVRRRGGFICLLIHHPPVTGLTHWRKRLADEARLEELLRRERVPIALHGHLHCDVRALRDVTRIYGTASASSGIAATPASYRVFDIEQEPGGWRVTMILKRYDVAAGCFAAVDRESWLVAPAQG